MSPVNEKMPAYTIKAVAARTGVPLHTLRAWERRYGVPKPPRAVANRYRLYGESDIADVLWMKRQVEAGLSPSQAGALLRQRHQESSAPAVGLRAQGARPLAHYRAVTEQALLAFDAHDAHQAFGEALALYPMEQVALQVIAPAMHSIGDRWMRGEAAVGQEHFASNFFRQRLLTALQAQPEPSAATPLLVAACAPDEQHELGLLICALVARRQGWRVAYLGQRTPLADLRDACRNASPRAVLVSTATVIGLANLIPLLDESARPAVPLYFGGALPEAVPALRARLPGIYVGADPAAALQVIERAPRLRRVAPARRALASARALREASAELSVRARGSLAAHLPALAAEYKNALAFATAFLVDGLACALAYATPELVDAEARWLRATLPSRNVELSFVRTYLKSFDRAVAAVLPGPVHAHAAPLIARLSGALATEPQPA